MTREPPQADLCPTCGAADCRDIYHAPNPLSEGATRARVLAEVSRERDRQNAKWGGNSLHTVNDPLRALAVLAEETGEVAREIVEWDAKRTPDLSGYRKELIQVAAVAVAMVQALDRAASTGGK